MKHLTSTQIICSLAAVAISLAGCTRTHRPMADAGASEVAEAIARIHAPDATPALWGEGDRAFACDAMPEAYHVELGENTMTLTRVADRMDNARRIAREFYEAGQAHLASGAYVAAVAEFEKLLAGARWVPSDPVIAKLAGQAEYRVADAVWLSEVAFKKELLRRANYGADVASMRVSWPNVQEALVLDHSLTRADDRRIPGIATYEPRTYIQDYDLELPQDAVIADPIPASLSTMDLHPPAPPSPEQIDQVRTAIEKATTRIAVGSRRKWK